MNMSEIMDTLKLVKIGSTVLQFVLYVALILLVLFICLAATGKKSAVCIGILADVLLFVCAIVFIIAIFVLNDNIKEILGDEMTIKAMPGLILTAVLGVANMLVIIIGRKKL